MIFYKWEKSMNERKREWDIIRIIACFCVVVIHVSGYGMEIKDPHTTDWMIRNLIVSMIRCAAPIFFMLSGILFMEKKVNFSELYKKYVARIVIAWASWSFFYALIDYVAYKKNHDHALEYFLLRFVSGHYHLWFLPAIFVVYISLPVLQKIVKLLDEKELKYIGIIVLIGIVCKETIPPLANSKILDAALENFPSFGISIGVLYFVLGYYLYRYINIFSGKKCLCIYLGSCMCAAILNMIFSFKHGQHMSVASGYLSIWVVTASATAFIILEKGLERCKIKFWNETILQSISKCTFGIYLLHTFLIEQVYRRVGLPQERFPTIVSVILFSVATFLISYMIIWCVRKIPIIGKWIV